MIGRVCLFICLFVGSFVREARCDFKFLKRQKSDFNEIWHRHLAYMPNFAVSFSEVKVKAQGQNRRTENLPSGLRYLHQIWESDRSNFGTKYDFRQSSIWRPA